MLNYKVRTERHINMQCGEFGLSQGRKKNQKDCNDFRLHCQLADNIIFRSLKKKNKNSICVETGTGQ